MNPDALERRLREEGRTLRLSIPDTLEQRIVAATRAAPRPRPLGRPLAALLVLVLAGWWALDQGLSGGPAAAESTQALSTLQQVTRIDVVAETWGSSALGTAEAALLAEVEAWRQDAEEVTQQVLDGIPEPMLRLLFPG